MDTIKKDLLKLSRISPQLNYSVSLAKMLSDSQESTRKIIETYFAAQPIDYVKELGEFERINESHTPEDNKVFIFVPAFNEEKNLRNLVNQYVKQRDSSEPLNPDLYEVCFVVNYPESVDSKVNKSYAKCFENAIDILLDEKKNHPNIHILSKSFGESEGSLGRARKYGMDYCLWRMLKKNTTSIDQSIIISNEGDTLEIPNTYIYEFTKLFEKGNPKLVQGKIEYPKEITDICEPLRLFVGCREAVHFGQGLAINDFPYFDGIMPIGRNFAVSPRICAHIGGIDPIRRKDTDDDMNFGTDIHTLLGERVKSVCAIPLITNPRREVTIVRDIIAGRKEDSKKSYENFHENRALYDLKYEDILATVKKEIPSKIPNRAIRCELLNQYFQWVVISRYKANLDHIVDFDTIITKHRNHEISYWDKEKQLCAAFERHFQRMTKEERYAMEKALVSEALSWFNRFVEPMGEVYNCTKEGLKSTLQ